MKYKKYPIYKNSGLDWLGDIPENWKLLKNRHIFKPKDKVLNDKEDMTVLSLTTNGVKVKKNLSFGKSTESYIGHQMVYPENLVFTPRDFDQTPILSGVSKYKGCISNLYIVLKTNSKAYNHFVNYYWWGLKYKVNYFKNFSYGIRFSYNFDQFKEIPFLQPPIQEQQQIANFLDNATVKIDTLIEKQTKLIEILKEKRQAAISHAVTKGINSNVKMKNSDVEWLGDIPEHWKVKRTKFLFKIRKRIAGKDGHQVLSITQKGIKKKDTKSGAGQLSMDYSKYQFAYVGDFAMNHMDLLTGYVDITKYDGVISPDYRVFTLEDKNSNPNYYLYLYQNGYKNKIFYKYGQGSSQLGRWRLPTDQFNKFRFPCPPLKEQQQIVNYLDEKTSTIDKLIEKANKSIILLKEKRTALISAAVTGKIDVREAV